MSVVRGIPWKEGPQPTSAAVALPDYQVIYSKQQDVTTEQTYWISRRNPWPCSATGRGHEEPQEQAAGGGVNMIFQH